MNARLLKLTSVLFLSPLLALSPFAVYGQGTNVGDAPPPANFTYINSHYDIEITNGHLLLAPLKNRPEVSAAWGPGNLHSVSATIDNLTKYLKIENPNLNIVLSPGVAEATISDLKIHSDDMKAITEAVGIATAGKIRGTSLSGKDNWTFMLQSNQRSMQGIEVFNLSGYLQTVGDADKRSEKIDEIMILIEQTVRQLQAANDLPMEEPQFRYHSGTRLLIVTGSPEAIEVSRKIINALTEEKTKTDARQELLDLVRPQNQK